MSESFTTRRDGYFFLKTHGLITARSVLHFQENSGVYGNISLSKIKCSNAQMRPHIFDVLVKFFTNDVTNKVRSSGDLP